MSNITRPMMMSDVALGGLAAENPTWVHACELYLEMFDLPANAEVFTNEGPWLHGEYRDGQWIWDHEDGMWVKDLPYPPPGDSRPQKG